MQRVVREALERIQSLLPTLENSLQNGDATAAGRLCRAIGESARTVVAEQSRVAAAKVENAVSGGHLQQAVTALAALKESVARLEAVVKRGAMEG